MGLNTDDFEYLGSEKKEEIIKEKPIIKEGQKKIEEEKQKEEVANTEKEKQESSIFVVKVNAGKETKSFELISERVRSKNLGVYSLVRPHGLKGYIIIEARNKENAEEACFNLPYVKGILPKSLSFEEIKNMVEPKTSEISIEKNDIVEIISETFKNEQAKVLRVDKIKGEIVVSLLNAVIPLPVTIKIDNVRVIRREEEKS